jgi:hypothetical protein
VQTSLRIIADLCKKSSHVRNFAVLNHKTCTYWSKAFKQFGADVRTEYYALLEAATAIRFEHNEQQFSRIENKIIIHFVEEQWDLLLIDPAEIEQRLRQLTHLMAAFRNLIAMKCAWILNNVERHETRSQRSFFGVALTLVKDFNCFLLNEPKRISPKLCRLLR